MSSSLIPDRIDRALRAVRKGRSDEAITLLREAVALEQEPLRLEAALLLGK